MYVFVEYISEKFGEKLPPNSLKEKTRSFDGQIISVISTKHTSFLIALKRKTDIQCNYKREQQFPSFSKHVKCTVTVCVFTTRDLIT